MPKILIYCCSILFSMFISQACWANTYADSLKVELAQAEDDSMRLDLLKRIAFSFVESDIEQLKVYADQYLDEVQRSGLEQYRAKGINLKAIYYDVKEQPDKSIPLFNQALELAKDLGDKPFQMDIINNIGFAYAKIQEYDIAESYHKEAYETALKGYEYHRRALYSLNLALDYIQQGKFEEGLAMVEEHTQAYQKMDESHSNWAYILNGQLGAYAQIYLGLNDSEKAMEYVNKLIEHSKKHSFHYYSIDSYLLKGDIEKEFNKKNAAYLSYKKALDIAQERNIKEKDVKIYLSLARIETLRKNYSNALSFAERAYEDSKKSKQLALSATALESLVEINLRLKKYPQSFAYQKEMLAINDSLSIRKRKVNTNNLNFQLKLAKIDAEREMLTSKNALSQAELRKRGYTIILVAAIAGIVALISWFLYYTSKKKAEQNKLLEIRVKERTKELDRLHAKLTDANDELERFAHISSHDLKDPLDQIIREVKALESYKEEFKPDQHEYLKFITDGSQQLEQLIDDLFAFSQLSYKDDLPLEDCNVKAIVEEASTHISQLFKEKNAEIIFHDLPIIQSNASQLRIILKNLIENGIKYNTSTHPKVNIGYEQQGEQHFIEVKDNGIGIDPKFHTEVFGMFKRLHSRKEYDGTGLGLAICQQIAHSLGGEIRLSSALGKGATFTLILPVNLAHSKSTKV